MTVSFKCTLVQVSPLMVFPSRKIVQNFLKGLRKHLPTKFWQIAHNSQKKFFIQPFSRSTEILHAISFIGKKNFSISNSSTHGSYVYFMLIHHLMGRPLKRGSRGPKDLPGAALAIRNPFAHSCLYNGEVLLYIVYNIKFLQTVVAAYSCTSICYFYNH